MKRLAWLAVGCAALLWSSAGIAQDCAGDCNRDNTVAINELITCVNIGLGSSPVSSCESCDVNGDGTVAINELITSVNNALGGCGPIGPTCGDGTIDEGEDCDDGNNFGGDGCAVNCTDEDVRVGIFDSTRTLATVQTEALPIGLPLTGQQTLRTGRGRSTDTVLANGGIFKAGEIPAVIRADELIFPPVKVTGLVCACVRGIPQPDIFGPGIAASGSIGCGAQGLSDIDVRTIQDHNTTPGSPGNNSQGSPDDPECDDVSPLLAGLTSAACLEGSGALCNDADSQHIGACNGPRELSRSGGMAAPGSALISYSTAIGLLRDAGSCRLDKPMRNGRCLFEDYGPDCTPCTADDADFGNTEINPGGTGIAEAAVFDANNANAVIDDGENCFGAPCITRVVGSAFNCDELQPGTTGGLSGGSIAIAFPSVDARTIGDNVTSTVFFVK